MTLASRPRSGISEVDDTATAARRFLMYGLLPAWFVPGVADWVMHRRTKIEDTAGTKESVIHALMMAQLGAPLTAALMLEINPLLLVVMTGGALTHEATAAWDVRTAADSSRELRPAEQMIHSFLETLPFMAVSSLAILHFDQLRILLRSQQRRDAWTLRRKQDPLPRSYITAVFTLGAALIVLPYGEELARCVAAARRRAHAPRT